MHPAVGGRFESVCMCLWVCIGAFMYTWCSRVVINLVKNYVTLGGYVREAMLTDHKYLFTFFGFLVFLLNPCTYSPRILAPMPNMFVYQ